MSGQGKTFDPSHKRRMIGVSPSDETKRLRAESLRRRRAADRAARGSGKITDPENPKVGEYTQAGAKVVKVSKNSVTIRGV